MYIITLEATAESQSCKAVFKGDATNANALEKIIGSNLNACLRELSDDLLALSFAQFEKGQEAHHG